MTAELYERLFSGIDAVHGALAVAIELPPHKKKAVPSLLHLAMVELVSLKMALADSYGEEGSDE